MLVVYFCKVMTARSKNCDQFHAGCCAHMYSY